VRALVPAALTAVLAALPAGAVAAPTLAGCPVLPDGDPWNLRVDHLPAARDSAALMRSIGLGARLHADFSSRGRYGIPVNVAGAGTRRHRVRFTYAAESDRVPYPIPARPRIERGADRHLLVVDRDACRLYELYAARRTPRGWVAGSGAVWDLRRPRPRPLGWTSADAAGLPITPGLARWEEVRAGRIAHALRFTAPRTRRAFVPPARHHAGVSDDPALPPMGVRLRLRASVRIAAFPPQARVVLRALREYGMILADNGSPLFVSGTPSPGWDDDDLHALGRLSGRHFEVIDTRGLGVP